jgi:hypothetical protein
MNTRDIFFAAATLSVVIASAQTKPPLPSEQIDIVKSFEPELMRSAKVAQQPNLPRLTTDTIGPLGYDVTDRLVKVEYKPAEVRPLSFSAFKKEEKLPVVRLKAGFGSYLSPLIDLQMANRKQDKYKAGLGMDFFSARNKKIENQQMMRLNAKGDFTYNFDKFYVGANAGFGLHQVHFYGYNDEDTSFTRDEARHTYKSFDGGINFGHIGSNAIGLEYKGHLNIGGINNTYGHKETNLDIAVNALKTFKENYGAGLRLDMEQSSLKSSPSNRSQFNVGITPYGRLELKDIWMLTAGPSIWFLDGDVHLYPDIRSQVKIYKDYLVMYNEWYGRTKLNTLQSASTQNPFLTEDMNWKNYREETRNFVGIKGALPFGVDYDILFAQQVYRDKPLFLNDSADYRKFNFVYDDKLSAINPHVGLGYRFAEAFRSSLTFDYYLYKTKDQAEAWHMPTMRLGWHNTFQWEDKLAVKATVLLNGGAKALDETSTVVTLKPNVDISFEAAYQFNKYIGFFAQLNNLAFVKYKEYYRYPSFGFSALGGVIVSY